MLIFGSRPLWCHKRLNASLTFLWGDIPLLPPVATRLTSLGTSDNRREFSQEAVNRGLNMPLPASHGRTLQGFLEVAKQQVKDQFHADDPELVQQEMFVCMFSGGTCLQSCAMNGRIVRHYRSFTISPSFSNPHPSLSFALLAALLSFAQRSLCSSASSPAPLKKECEAAL